MVHYTSQVLCTIIGHPFYINPYNNYLPNSNYFCPLKLGHRVEILLVSFESEILLGLNHDTLGTFSIFFIFWNEKRKTFPRNSTNIFNLIKLQNLHKVILYF